MTSTPSTRRQLDGVAVLVSHDAIQPARPRHRRGGLREKLCTDALIDFHKEVSAAGKNRQRLEPQTFADHEKLLTTSQCSFVRVPAAPRYTKW